MEVERLRESREDLIRPLKKVQSCGNYTWVITNYCLAHKALYKEN